MKLNYGFMKFRQTIKYEDGRIFGHVGDVMMFCRQDIMTISLIITNNANQFRGIDTIPVKNFHRLFKVLNSIHLLCCEGILNNNMIFNEGTVYQFKNHVFRSLNSKTQPWTQDKKTPQGEIWDTAVFFQQGSWLLTGAFKVISEKEANVYRKEYEKQMNFKKFDL